MLRCSVVVAVIVVLPNPIGTVSDQLPYESALVDANAAVPPVPPTASATTRAPGDVVPLTGTVALSTLAPLDGDVTASGSVPGGPWVT